MPTNGYVKMWDNWSKKRSSIPVYDLWLDEYKDILERNKHGEVFINHSKNNIISDYSNL